MVVQLKCTSSGTLIRQRDDNGSSESSHAQEECMPRDLRAV